MIRSRLAVPLAAVPALLALAFTGTASAAPSSPALALTSMSSAAAKPNSNIGGTPLKYTPSSLTAKPSGPKPAQCSTAKAAFTITNTTTKSQTITLGGKPFGVLKPKAKGSICAFTTKPLTATFGLKGSAKAKLVVKIT